MQCGFDRIPVVHHSGDYEFIRLVLKEHFLLRFFIDKNIRAGWLTFWCFYGGLSLIDRMTNWDETVTVYWLAKKLFMEFVVSSEKYGSMAFYNYVCLTFWSTTVMNITAVSQIYAANPS